MLLHLFSIGRRRCHMKARSDRRWIKRCRYWLQQARLHRLAARGPVVWANKIYAIFLDDDDGDPAAYAPVSPRMMVCEHMDMHSRVIHATPDARLSRKDLMAYYALYNILPLSPYAHIQSEGWSVSLSHPSIPHPQISARDDCSTPLALLLPSFLLLLVAVCL
jgi:hypothetical protein